VTDAIRHEIETKQERLQALMKERGWSAVLMSRHENLAWATAGRVEARVPLGKETAVGSLLVTKEGKRFCITSNNEAARLGDEEFAGLDVEPAIYPWTENAAGDLAHKLGGATIASDAGQAGFHPVDLTSLRVPLLEPEVERFRAVGQAVAEATTRVLKGLKPGMSEDEMGARISADLLAQHITPSVLLMATDERIFRYKHAVPRAGVLKNYGMLNLCARKWGMVISITRFIHFGTMSPELAANFEKAARINAALLHASREGATSAHLYDVAAKAYAAVGEAEEITKHHQGGPCGYVERDWVATPKGTERVQAVQGFAWNPSIKGAKAEDTALLRDGQIEIVTATRDLPVIEAEVGGKVYRSAGVYLA